MIRSLVELKLASEERKLGGSLDYARFLLRASLGAFLRFTKLISVSEYRKRLPAPPYHAARLIATRAADCGECLGIEIRMAAKAGVSPGTVRSILEDPTRLDEELSRVVRFTNSVVEAKYDGDDDREQLRGLYGDAGLAELALAIAAVQAFPTIKRTLGFASSCASNPPSIP